MVRAVHVSGTKTLAVAATFCALAIVQPWCAMAQQMAPPVSPPAATDTPTDAASMQGVHDYLDTSTGPVEISQLGIMARDAHATLEDGQKVTGVAVVDISDKGAAAKALGTHHVSHMVVGGALLGAGVAAAVLFPPALIGVLIIANSHVGMSYDLVIGVDGFRVRNTMELMQTVADVQPGDTLYLAIVRGGHRVQIPVQMPERIQ